MFFSFCGHDFGLLTISLKIVSIWSDYLNQFIHSEGQHLELFNFPHSNHEISLKQIKIKPLIKNEHKQY